MHNSFVAGSYHTINCMHDQCLASGAHRNLSGLPCALEARTPFQLWSCSQQRENTMHSCGWKPRSDDLKYQVEQGSAGRAHGIFKGLGVHDVCELSSFQWNCSFRQPSSPVMSCDATNWLLI